MHTVVWYLASAIADRDPAVWVTGPESDATVLVLTTLGIAAGPTQVPIYCNFATAAAAGVYPCGVLEAP